MSARAASRSSVVKVMYPPNCSIAAAYSFFEISPPAAVVAEKGYTCFSGEYVRRPVIAISRLDEQFGDSVETQLDVGRNNVGALVAEYAIVINLQLNIFSGILCIRLYHVKMFIFS